MSYPLLSRRLKRPGEVMTQALEDWLQAEVASSGKPGDVNVGLDDYDSAIEGLKGGFEHPKNFTMGKHNGHMDRIRLDFEAFAETPPDHKDYPKAAAKIVFDSLMEISGSYRNQCYVEAQDAQDYLSLRKKAIGINIGTSVVNRLVALVRPNGDFSDARISAEGLGSDLESVIDTADRAIKQLGNRVHIGYDLKQPNSRSAQEMISAQYHWLNFALDSMILIAKHQHNYKDVPFMEPISITEQSGSLYYPLAQRVNWAEVLAA